jgi:hypothetical protein
MHCFGSDGGSPINAVAFNVLHVRSAKELKKTCYKIDKVANRKLSAMARRFSRLNYGLKLLRNPNATDSNTVSEPPTGSVLKFFKDRQGREVEYKGKEGIDKTAEKGSVYPFGIKFAAMTIQNGAVESAGSARVVKFSKSILTQADGITNKGQTLVATDEILGTVLNITAANSPNKFARGEHPARTILRVGVKDNTPAKVKSSITGMTYKVFMQSTSLVLPFGRKVGAAQDEMAEIMSSIKKTMPGKFTGKIVSTSFLPEVIKL